MINSRAKGKRGELQAKDYLQSLGFKDARRTAQFNGKDGGKSDVVCEESLPQIHIEVKLVKELDLGTAALREACKQAERDAATRGQTWVVLWRKHAARQWNLTTMFWGYCVTICSDDQIRSMLWHLEETHLGNCSAVENKGVRQ